MKQMLYQWGLFCLTFIASLNLGAQTRVQCERNFVIKTNVTPSTCMANGIIEVTLEGDLSDIEMSMTEYALRPIDGTEGTSLPFSKNNTLRSIAAGTYIVSVRTFCIEEANIGVVTESSNVVVGGNYKPLMVELDLSRTRKPYGACPTGAIALNVVNNTGYGDLTFHLSKAPTGVSLGQIYPTKGSIVSGSIQYTLPDLYPIGDYQIDVYDNCSKATITFSLEEVTGLPPMSLSGSSFKRPNSLGNSHNTIQLSGLSVNQTTHPDYYRYYIDKMYEIALVPAAQAPVESDWLAWNSSSMLFTVPGGYKDYYSAQSLKAYVRVKGCAATMQLILTAALNYPYMSNSNSNNVCDYYRLTTTNYQDQDGFWSYPVNVKITNTTDNNIVVFDQDYATPPISISVDNALYGKNYHILVTDSEGTTNEMRNNGTHNTIRPFSPYIYTSNITYDCNDFKVNIQPEYYGYNCVPIEMTIKKLNTVSGEYEHFLDYTFETVNSVNFTWPYGKYQLTAVYVNHIKEDGAPLQNSITLTVDPRRPTSMTISSISSASTWTDLSNEYYGYLQIRGNTTFSVGTRFTVTEAPQGYRHLGRTITATSSGDYFYFGNSDSNSSSSSIFMPEGTYTITAEDDCGTTISASAYLTTGFDAQDVKYIVEENECVGGRIKLDTQNGGFVKLRGVANSGYTNFKVIKGPSGGYETTTKKYDQELQIVADGEYIIGTVINTSYNTYYIRQDTIRFEKSKPTLKPSVTAGYVCTDPEALVGYLMFTGQGGKAPYQFELLNEDETPTGLTAAGGHDERIVFNYGLAGETYVVRITDACGNSTTQQITLADLKTQSIIYAIPPSGEYCKGEEIKINCITLGQTTYLWEKKISEGVYEFVSNNQNLRIPSATEAHSGVYRVSVTPEYCGESITRELAIRVCPDLTINDVSEDQTIRVGARAEAMSCDISGGKGNFIYQWQESTDLVSWTNIVAGTTPTYAPIHAKTGIYYYRLQITDDCTTIVSDIITINTTPRYLIVNPNIHTLR